MAFLVAAIGLSVFCVVFLFAFNLSTNRAQYPILGAGSAFLLIVFLIGWTVISYVRELNSSLAEFISEYRRWKRMKSVYPVGKWSTDWIIMKGCPIADETGIYQQVSNSNGFLNALLQQLCKPILIPWTEMKAVRWVADQGIFVDLNDGSSLRYGNSQRLFDDATKHLPPGAALLEQRTEPF